jgi:hypothetical protein
MPRTAAHNKKSAVPLQLARRDQPIKRAAASGARKAALICLCVPQLVAAADTV